MTDTVTEPFDTERAIAIAQEVRDVITIHDALATRTDDPVFLDLIALSRRWWLRWLAAGLCGMCRASRIAAAWWTQSPTPG